MTEQVTKDDPRVISYRTLRMAIGIIGFLLPIVLIFGKIFLWSPGIQDSISNYYHTNMRDVLVGMLCAIGVFLLSYKGYDTPVGRLPFVRGADDLASNVAGIGAIGVALFPTQKHPATFDQLVGYKYPAGLHVLFAFVFFVSLAYILIWRFTDHGLSEEEPRNEIAESRMVGCDFIYRACGITILLSIALIGVFWGLTGGVFDWQYAVLAFETLAIYAFSVAWFLKGSEYFKGVVGLVWSARSRTT